MSDEIDNLVNEFLDYGIAYCHADSDEEQLSIWDHLKDRIVARDTKALAALDSLTSESKPVEYPTIKEVAGKIVIKYYRNGKAYMKEYTDGKWGDEISSCPIPLAALDSLTAPCGENRQSIVTYRPEDQDEVSLRAGRVNLLVTDKQYSTRWYHIRVDVDRYKEFLTGEEPL